MARKKKKHAKLKSKESNCCYFIRNGADKKLVLRKYDNILRKHVEFVSSRLK